MDDPCILDLAYIMDASGSITPYWNDVLRFAQGVASRVNISSDGTHLAVIKFGEESAVEFGFKDGTNEKSVIDKLGKLDPPEAGARTYLHKALRDANSKLFDEGTNEFQFREDPSVRKVRRRKTRDYSDTKLIQSEPVLRF